MGVALGVLVPTRLDSPGVPEARPVGRAALWLAQSGIDVVFGDAADGGRLAGYVARPGRWEQAPPARIAAAYDRFPAALARRKHRSICQELANVPIGNPPDVTWLCQDKLATAELARALGVRTPQVESDPARFEDRLARWGSAYAKPRYGTAGRGVVRVSRGDPLPADPRYPQAAADGARILQQAVPPPDAWRGVVVRATAQREPTGSWIVNTPVVRRSRSDWVVNAERGADVVPARDVLSAPTVDAVMDICSRVHDALAERPSGALVVEVGIDLVIDADGQPWLLELNARPRGRLAVLAQQDPDRFAGEHDAAILRPFQRLHALASAVGVGR